MVLYLAWPVEGLEMVSMDRGQREAWVTQRCAPAVAWSHGSSMELSEQAGSALTLAHGESSHCLLRGWDWGKRLGERFDAAGYYQLALAAAVDLGNKKGTAEDLHAAGHHHPQLPPGPARSRSSSSEGHDLRHRAQCLQGQPASSATLRVGPLVGPSHPH
ncbi:hypothetical protein H8959_013773 [Pygathrix nigripes]